MLVVNKYILSLQVVHGFRYNDVFIDLADDGRKGDRTVLVVCWFGTFAIPLATKDLISCPVLLFILI